MHNFQLRYLDVTDNERLRNLMKELDDIKDRAGKVYWTFANSDNEECSFQFATTAKEVHLFLGTLSSAGLINLASLIADEFEKIAARELLFSIESRNTAFLITKTMHPCRNEVVFHLSPAH